MEYLNVSTASATGNPRNKTALKPGRSLMDWIKLTNSSTNLSGNGNRLRDISLDELAQHKNKNDAWLAIRGMVYNVSSYFEFHPGGEEELMRGVGIDATDLFDQVHKWVNYESMLKKCLVGRLRTDSMLPPVKRPQSKLAVGKDLSMPPPFPSLSASSAGMVTTDWMQNLTTVTIVLYTRQKGLDARRISTSIDGNVFHTRIYSDDWLRCFDYQIRLAEDVHPFCKPTVSLTTGKVELVLHKKQIALHWQKLGDLEEVIQGFQPLGQAPPFFRRSVLTRKSRVNHNVFLCTLTFPTGQNFHVPVGWHVQLKLCLEDGTEVIRSYTPITSTLSSCETTDCPSISESPTALHFLIKIYANGPFTSALDRLSEGSRSIEVSNPIGNFVGSQLEGKNLVAIAAGTGITPLIRVAIDVLRNNRRVSLLFFNRTQDDIIWKEEFRELELKYPNKFKLWHVLSEPDDEWPGLRGRISKSVLATTILSEEYHDVGSNFACVCGPSDFTLETLRLLDSAGYTQETVHAFSG